MLTVARKGQRPRVPVRRILADAGLMFEQAGMSALVAGRLAKVGVAIAALVLVVKVVAWLQVRSLGDSYSKHRTDYCLSNLYQVSVSLRMYAGDFDDRLPRGAAWMDETLPYMKSADMFYCTEGSGRPLFTYAMNRAMPQQAVTPIADQATTVLVFDSKPVQRSTVGGAELLSRPARHVAPSHGDQSKQGGRGNNIGYVDTHSRWRHEGLEWLDGQEVK